MDERLPGTIHTVAQAIIDEGGEALPVRMDGRYAESITSGVQAVVAKWGKVDILVNNAGILRDKMIFSMDEQDWDAVVDVHLKGHFCPTRHVSAHWRARVKAGEESVDGRIINTASPSGLYGNVGQSNYGAAKAGIATLTTVWALELARLGVTVNCLAPTAMTRLVMEVMGGEDAVSDEVKESMAPRWISAVMAWLCSDEARNVTGRVFDVRGDRIQIVEGWHGGPVGENTGDPTELGPVMAKLMAEARLNSDLYGNDVEGPGRPSHDI
jgi:NAD(P)-dependent dehydrogenase (short-subunit alcohol dehydrogenase family)